MFILSATAVSAGAWMMQQRQQTSVTSQEMRATSGQAAPQASSESSPLRLLLASAAAMIPHPAKVARGGEDAYFLAADGRCVGVADGVGGWAEVGVDPGLYSRELMRHAQEAAAASRVRGAREPLAIMETAHKLTKARGSCTACILCVEGDTLHGANLGDSGFMIVRDGALAFMSPQQQHEFNFPFQLGSADAMSDVPSEAEFFSIPVQPNDVVVAATDGVLDNVYPDEAAALVAASKARGEEPRRAAQALAEFARTRAADPGHLSPFAYAAQQMGYRYFGGKMDDITVVVAYVVPEESKSVEGEDKLLSKL